MKKLKKEYSHSYIEGIKKTGFILENNITLSLKKFKWSVINNRLYIDDISQIPREIDILAYKHFYSREHEILFYTTLIISCKKSEKNIWSFLSRKFDMDDSNVDFLPLHQCSNNKIINYLLDIDIDLIKASINRSFDEEPYLREIFGVDKEIFGFQEQNKNTGNPDNNKNIYHSIDQLIKSLTYEISSKKIKVKMKSYFYDFHLISIVDSNMIEFEFEDNNVPPYKESNHLIYLKKHIVNKEDKFFRIHFFTTDYFNTFLENFEKYHSWYTKFYISLMNNFYKDIFTDLSKKNILFDDFRNSLESAMIDYNINAEITNLIFDEEKNYLLVVIKCDTKIFEEIKKNEQIRSEAATLLKRIYKYEGEFFFQELPLYLKWEDSRIEE